MKRREKLRLAELIAGCPILATSLFLSQGWKTVNLDPAYYAFDYFGLETGSAAGISASSPASSTSTAEPGTMSKLTASFPAG